MFSLSRGCLFYWGGGEGVFILLGRWGGGVFILSGCLSTVVAPVFLPILGKDFALETGWMPLTIQDTGLDS